jgi:hypothetical protein
MLYWQSPEQCLIKQAVNRRICANAKRQSQNCDHSKSGLMPQLSQRVTRILQ